MRMKIKKMERDYYEKNDVNKCNCRCISGHRHHFTSVSCTIIWIIKLDTYQGNVSIKGRIDSITYLDNGLGKNKEESFLGKLFK